MQRLYKTRVQFPKTFHSVTPLRRKTYLLFMGITRLRNKGYLLIMQQQKLILGLRPGRRVQTHLTSFFCLHVERPDTIPKADGIPIGRWTLPTSRCLPTYLALSPPHISCADFSFPASHLHSIRTSSQRTSFFFCFRACPYQVAFCPLARGYHPQASDSCWGASSYLYY